MAKKSIPLENLAAFGSRLRSARLAAGFTQVQVGEKLGVSHAAVNRWETGKDEPPPGGIVALAVLYGKSTDWLLLGADPEDNHKERSAYKNEAIIRLPRGDPEPLSDEHADLLEKAVVVLRAEGSAAHYAESLTANIKSSYKGVQQARLLEGSAGMKAASGDS